MYRRVFYIILCALLLFSARPSNGVSAQLEDSLLEEGGAGATVALLSVVHIRSTGIFDNDNDLLPRIAYAETRDGTANDTYREGYHGGIWAVEESAFLNTQDNATHSSLTEVFEDIQQEFGIDWSSTTWRDLRKPFYSAIAARLVLFVTTMPIPISSDVQGQANFWAQYYNPGGSTESFISAITSSCTQVVYHTESRSYTFATYFSQASAYTVGCGPFNLNRCRRTRYHMRSTVAYGTNYMLVNTLVDVCCPGFQGTPPNCYLTTIGFLETSYAISESSSHLQVPVVRSGSTASTAVVVVATNASSGTASEIDYVQVIEAVEFQSGENEKEVNISLVNDKRAEGNETFELYLTGATGVILSPYPLTMVVITNEDHVPGRPENLQATVLSSSSASVQWQAPPSTNPQNLLLMYTLLLLDEQFGLPSITVDVNSSITSYTFTELEEFNMYTCSVYPVNEVGTGLPSSINFTTQEDVPTSSPQNLFGFASDSQTLSLSWDLPPPREQNGVIRGYKINITEVETRATWQVTSNTSSVTVPMLHPYYTYEWRVSAFTIGDGPYTEASTVMTLEDVPTSAPQNTVGTAPTSRSITLQWDPPPIEDQNGIIVLYQIDVIEVESGMLFQYIFSGTFIFIPNLHPYYTYQWVVSASTTVGYGPDTEPSIVTTPEDAPSGPPQNFSAEATSSRTVYLTWNPPLPEEQNGIITGYFINVTLSERGELFQVFSEMSELTVESLRPYSTYSFVIKAQTNVGIGPFSTVPVVASTFEDVPEEPVNANVMRVDGAPTMLEVTWEPPIEPNGVILTYTVYCDEIQHSSGSGLQNDGNFLTPFDDDDDSTAEFTTVVPGNQTQTFVMGLTPFITYDCYITANTSVGEGAPSIIQSAQTDETIPDGPPLNLTASSVNSSAILLTWFEPLIPNGIVVSFTIMYSTSGAVQQSGTITIPNSRRFTVTGLYAGRVYEFSLLASTRVGPGPIATAVARTEQLSPDSPPENVNSLVLSSTSAIITWTPPPPEHQNGPIVYYSVVIGDQLFDLSDITITTSFTNYTFNDLQEYDIYSCTVAAATIVGVGVFSVPIEFRTLQDVPTSPPENLTGIASSPTVVTFTWFPPPAIDVNGIIQFYEVQITERETDRYWSFFAIDPSINLASLHPYFVYECTVAAHTIATGPYTNVSTVQTHEAAPSAPPRNLSVTSITSNSISLIWESPLFSEANGIIRKYVVMAIETETGRVFTETTNTTRGTLTNLHPYYTYSCAVAAETVSLGPYSSPQIFVQLLEDVPSGPPATASGVATDSTTVVLSWNPPQPENQNGIIRSYIINVTELDTGSAFSLISIQMETTLLGLHPFYLYEISITSVTVGPGPSSTISVKTLEDAPSDTPQNFAVTMTNSRSISLIWDPPPEEHRNGIIIGYVISVSSTNTGETFQSFTSMDSAEVDGLRPFTTYFIAVAAQTNAGVGPFSTTLQADTTEAPPSSPPQDLVAVPLSSTAISLTWMPPPLSSQNGIIREYTININELETGNVFQHVSTTTSITVTTLHPYYSYSCTVSAYTVAMGPYTEAVTAMTLEDIPSGYPQNFQANATTSQSATLTWNLPFLQEQNGIITGYVIEISELGIGETSQLSTAFLNRTINDLFPFTTYQLRIAASTDIGTGPFSPAFTITTLEDVPTSPPQNAVGVAPNSRMISLSWDPPPPREQNGVIREYRINISEVETGEVIHFVSASTQLDVSMLHPFYTYEWVVSAYTIGNGPYTVISTITTPEDVPSGAPQNLTGEALNSRQILLAWDSPLSQDRNGIITGFVVSVTTLSTGEQLQFVTASNNIIVSSLSPYTVYDCIVAATTSVGTGPFSEAFTLLTMEEGPGSHPLNITGSAVNSTHIRLEWDPPRISDQMGIVREYRINVTELETGVEFRFTAEVNEIIIGSFHPYYTYSCIITAFTVDEGPYSDETVIRTHEDTPSGPPRDLQVFATGSSMIFLTWDPPLFEQQNGIIRQYLITLMSGQTAITATSMNTNATISGLRPFTTYQCSVAAFTVSAGPATGTTPVTTFEDAPSAPPDNLELDILNSTTLAITWQPPAAENRNGIIRAYTIIVKEMETGTMNNYVTDSTHTTLTDLHPFYTYSISVAAETVDIGPFTAEVTAQMPEDVPTSPPLDLVITNISASSFLLSWRSPPFEDQNGIIRQYIIDVTEENTGTTFQMTSTETQMIISFLHPYYNYTCVIAAVTVDNGPYSVPITAATSEDFPSSPPENLHVEIQNSTSVMITWDPPPTESQNGIITGYFINVTLLENEEVFQLFSATEVLLTDTLKPFRTYNFVIAAQTRVGTGPYSRTVTTRTPEDAPSAQPEDLQITEVTSTSVLLQWSPPPANQQNGIIRHYIIRVTEEDTGTSYSTNALAALEHTIGALHPFYTYTFSVSAVTLAAGPYTDDYSVKTLEDIPSTHPTLVEVTAVDSRTLFLAWSPLPTEHQNGIIRGYVINISAIESGEQLQFTSIITSLEIDDLHPHYTYNCIVAAFTIGIGPFSEISRVQLPEDVPNAAPENLTGEALSSTSIIISWKPPPTEAQNGIIILYTIRSLEVPTNRNLSYQQEGQQTMLVIDSLHPFYDYQYFVGAETVVGSGPLSETVTTRTLQDIPSGSPRNVLVTAMSSTSILVTWDSPLESEQNGIIISYTVAYVNLNRSEDQQISLSTTQRQLSITDLQEYEEYSFRVAAATTVGQGPFSDPSLIFTFEDVPSGPPLNIVAVNTSSTSLWVSWEPPLPAERNGIIISYTVTYASSGTSAEMSEVTSNTGTILEGLNIFEVYNVTVSATTINGSGPLAYTVERTSSDIPSEPLELAYRNLTATSIEVTWLPPANRNGIIERYYLVYTESDSSTNTTADIPGNQQAYNITNLMEYERYVVRVFAVTDRGRGPSSTPLDILTDQYLPDAPEDFMIEALSSTAVRATWLEPLDSNGVLQGYSLTISVVTPYLLPFNTTFQLTQHEFSLNISDLHPFADYFLVLRARTAVGLGSETVNSVQTRQDVPSAPPQNVTGEAINSTAIVISWKPPPITEQNGINILYTINLLEVPTAQTLTYQQEGQQTMLIIDSLHPYYNYEYSVGAETVVGSGPLSETVTTRTLQDIPSGTPRNFLATAMSSTSILVTWDSPLESEQNGNIISYTVAYVNLNRSEDQQISNSSTSQRQMLFTGLQEYEEYSFVVAATTTVGQGPFSDPSSVFTFEDAPSDTPQNFAVTLTNSQSIFLIWDPPPEEHRNGIIIGYVINVSSMDTGETFQSFTSTGSAEVDGLRPFTTYFIAVAAQTNAGVGPFSTTLQADTAEAPPSSSPQDLMAVPLSSTAISLTWMPPPLSSQNGIIREYTINITELETGEVFQHVSTTTSITVTILHPYYSYSCTVSAFTVAMGPYTEAVTVVTLEDIPSGYPRNFQATVATSRSAVLRWDPPFLQEQNGIITGYVIEINALGIGETSQLSTVFLNRTIDDLFPFTTYQLRIAASTSIGTGPFSPAFTITTLEDVPTSPPQNVVGVAPNSRMISLSWDPPPPREQNGIIREYRINISEVETGGVLYFVSVGTQLDVSMLHPFYTYEWVVSAYTIGNGPYTDISTLMTPEDVPSGAPQNLTGEALSSRQILLAWDSPLSQDYNGIITGFVVRVTTLSTGEQLQFVTASNNIIVSSLSPYTVYECIVAATTSVGTGPFSEAFTLLTMEEGPGSHPLNITGSAVNSTHIRLEWDPPRISDQMGIIREYRMNVTELETGVEFRFTTEVNEIIIGSFHPYYTYSCIITAFTVDEGPYSDATVIRTHEDIPSGPPRDLQVFATGSSAIFLSWNPPLFEQQNGIIRQYLITLMSGQTAITATSMNTNATISGLRPFTTYQCSVAAITVSAGPATGTTPVTTPEDAPSAPPEDLELDIVNSTTLAVTWQPPAAENRNGVIRAYTIIVKEIETETMNNYVTDTTQITLADLHPFYTYSISVAAETVAIGPFTAEVIAQMPEDVPTSPPLDLVITNISASSFLLSWRSPPFEDQNGIIRQYIIDITEENTRRTFQMTATETQKTISFLHPYYNYTCVIAAVTVDSGPYSMPITAATSEDSPSGPPENFRVEIQSSTSVIITWNPPPKESQNGIITGYFINVTLLENEEVFQLFSVAEVLLTDSLKPFRTYNFVIAAQTSVGIGPYSRTVTARTPEDAPSAQPEDLQITEVTSTSVLLRWSPPPADQQNGIIRHYIIRVTEEDTGTSYSTNALAALEHTIGTLHPFYTYTFSVSAVTLAAGPYTDDYSVKTLEDIPSTRPTFVDVTAIDSKALFLAWSPLPPEHQNGIIRGYVINISAIESGEQLHFTSNTTSLEIDDLHPHYTYNCIVAAFTIGIGPFSEIFTVQLPQDVPSAAPENLTGEALSSTSIIISWKPPPTEAQNGIIILYTLYVLEVPTNRTLTYQQEGQQTMLVIDSLHPYYDYECSVGAVTVVGSSPLSETVTTRTLQDIPSGSPRNVLVTAMSSTSILVTWDSPLESEQNGIIISYTVAYVNLNRSEDQQISSSTPQRQLLFTGLQEYEEYSFTVAAETTVGQGPFSDPTSVFTFEDVPSGPPLNIVAVNTSSTSLWVTWEPPQATERNGIIISYTVTYTSSGASAEMSEATSNTEISLEGLNIFQLYNVTVSANTINGSGPLTYTIERTSSDIPSEPLELAYRNLTATSIEVTWLPPANRNGIIERYYLVYTESDSSTNTTADIPGNQQAYNITNLLEYERYVVRVFAATDRGRGPSSTPLDVLTDQHLPDAPEDFMIEALSSTAVRATWLEPLDSNGVLQGYSLTISVMTPYLLPFNTTFQLTEREFSLNINDLHPFADYFLVLRARTSVGLGSETASSVQTRQDVPSAPPQNVTGEAVNSTAIVVSWKPPPITEQNGIIILYTIRLLEVPTQRPLSYLREGQQMMLVIHSLHPYYDYECSVGAVTVVGSSPLSETVTTRTRTDIPSGSPRNVLVTAMSSTSILVTWDSPLESEQNGVIISYTVAYVNLNRSGDQQISLSTTQRQLSITGLQEYEEYSFTVAATTTVGQGPFSDTSSTFTFQDVPSGPPLNIVAVNTSSTSLWVSWEPPLAAERNGIIISYTVTYTSSSASTEMSEVTSNTGTILEGLNIFDVYNVTVRANTISGSGPLAYTVERTSSDIPSEPLELAYRNLTATSIEVSWLPPANRNGIIERYYLVYTESVSSTNTTADIPGNQQAYNITNLLEYERYVVRVFAATDRGRGPSSTPLDVLTDQYLPDAPEDFMIEALSSTAVRATWLEPLDSNGVLQGYSLTISVMTPYLLPFNTTFQLTQREFSLDISELHPFADYFLVLRARTAVGLGSETTSSVQTRQDVPSAPPQNVTGEAINSTAIIISWNPPAITEQNGIIILYTINLLEVPTQRALAYLREGQLTMLVIDSLHPYYDYECSVGALTAVGSSPLSETVTTRTLQDIPVEAPQNIEATAVDSNAIDLSWDPPPPDSQNGDIEHYLINATAAESEEIVQLMSTMDSIRISNLEPFYTYSIVISAITIGPGPYSSPVTVTTFEDAPGAPVQNITVTVESPTTVVVAWYPPSVQEWNGILTGYSVVFELIRSDTTVQSTVSVPTPGSPLANNQDPRIVSLPLMMETAELDDLQESFIYRFTVFAENGAGRSVGSTPILQDMPEAAPSGSPTEVMITVLSSTSLVITWQPPDEFEQNGNITGYQILLSYHNETREMYTASGNSLSLQVDGLPIYTIIGNSIAAQTAVGTGPYSAVITARTLEDIPSAPDVSRQVDIEFLNSTTIEIRWSPPDSPNGVILDYQIIYFGYTLPETSVSQRNIGADVEIKDGPYALTITGSLSAVISTLIPGLSYSFMVRARTSIGYGDNSTAVIIEIVEAQTEEERGGGSNPLTVVALIVAAGLGCILAAVLAVIYFKRKRRSKKFILRKNDTSNGERDECELKDAVSIKNTLFRDISAAENAYSSQPGKVESPSTENVTKAETDSL